LGANRRIVFAGMLTVYACRIASTALEVPTSWALRCSARIAGWKLGRSRFQ